MSEKELKLFEVAMDLAVGECCSDDVEDIKRLEIKIKLIDSSFKAQKEAIKKAMNILKDNFLSEYVRSCDTSDGVGYDEIDTEHFTYKVYEILKEEK